MVSCSGSAVTQASPEETWATWVDVARWSDGEAIEAAHLNGDFVEGNTFVSKPKSFPPSTFTITRVDPPRLWVGEAAILPGWRMTSEHVIEPGVTGTKLTERVVISGWLSALFGWVVRRRLEALLTAMTEQIARQAEAGSHR